MNLEKKRQREIKVVSLMIHLYCRKHDDIDEKEMTTYAIKRIQHCPMMQDKTFCSKCTIHCYDPVHRQQIKTIMRYSGPRMMLYHPILAIKHMLVK